MENIENKETGVVEETTTEKTYTQAEVDALLQQESDEITKQVLELAKKKGLKEDDIEKIKKQIGSWDKLKDSQKEGSQRGRHRKNKVSD